MAYDRDLGFSTAPVGGFWNIRNWWAVVAAAVMAFGAVSAAVL